MSVTSDRSINIQNTSDVEYQQTFEAASNASGSGQNQLVALSSGNNSITIPTSAVAVTIIKPSGNTVQLYAKGVSGDTGVKLHLTDPDSISLGTSAVLVLNAASTVTVRLIFSQWIQTNKEPENGSH